MDHSIISIQQSAKEKISPELRTAWALLTLEKFVPSPDLLIVTKTADAASYCLGDTIKFTVTVDNPNQYEATNLVWNDAAPSQITIVGSDPAPLPTSIPAHTKITVYLLATADTAGSGLTNQVTVAGLVNGQSVDGTGTTTTTFTIEQCNEPPDTSKAFADHELSLAT